MAGPEALARLAMLGEVHDRLQSGIHEPVIEFSDRARIIEDLRQERPV